MKRRRTFYLAQVLAVLLLIFSAIANAMGQEARSILLYPELRAPFSNVFEDMMRGVESGFDGNVKRVPINASTSASEIQSLVGEIDPGLIFVLGKRSLDFLATVNSEAPVLAAGITKNGPSTVGISMLPDPKVIFEKLFFLKGKVETVYVVGRERDDDQLKRAGIYLESAGSVLKPSKVSNIQEAAKAYRQILNQVKPGDAIWILPRAPYLDNSVLSVILEQAWKRRILVFSSNPSHVKRGALFAVYPDNEGMGKSLGELGNKVVLKDNELEHGLQPLQDVLLAVNERTIKHLGLDLGDTVRSQIDLILPAR